VIELAHGLRFGKYEVRDKLGQGGYGIVYAARDTELGRDIALKFLRPDYAQKPQVLHRFLQEARSAAKILHPGIITVYEAGYVENTETVADGSVYIAMELLTGESLSSRLGGGRLPVEQAIELGMQCASALEAAHRSGIVHRDLKPDNIFLVPDTSLPGGERVKILDFGVAKLADSDPADDATGVHTSSMMMLGTPRYMSPEQCRSSARVDHRSDIYSLGCILFELLCGQSPYDGDAGELIAKHQLAPVPSPRWLRPELPAYLDVLVTTMMEKEPKDRPGSMEKVREGLAAAAAGGIPVEEFQRADTTLEGSASEASQPVRMPRGRWWLVPVIAVIPIAVGAIYLATRSHAPALAPAPAPGPAPVAATLVQPPAPVAVTEEDRHKKELDCRALVGDHKWAELQLCADQLSRLAADNPAARELTTLAVIEQRNATCMTKVSDAVAKKDVAEAYRWLDRIDDESVYKESAADAVGKLELALGARTPAITAHCNADKLASRAQQAITGGQYSAALALVEGSLRCRPDKNLYRLALLAACNGANASKARFYYAQLPAAQRTAMIQLCARNRITL
jgi:tRNA A-37 threonylcarbamoyl transferase component Bud32